MKCDHKFVDSQGCLKCGAFFEDLLDERGPDGVSERWKQTFLPPEVRDFADAQLAARYPPLDEVWRPVVARAQRAAELAGVTYGPNYLQLHFQLGPVSTTILIALEQVTNAFQGPTGPAWQDRIEHTLLRLRLARQRHEIKPTSTQELDDRVRRARADSEDWERSQPGGSVPKPPAGRT